MRKDFLEWCKAKALKHPQLREQIIDLYELAMDEIESGKGGEREIKLAEDDINKIIKKAG